VNYTESHDDRAWIDVITENPHNNGMSPTANDRRRTQLMAAVLFSSIGIPMISAGQDFLRSKGGVNNTYQRGDLNALDYRRLFRFPGTHAYFADWIAFRRSEAGQLLRLWQRPSEGYFKVVPAPGSTACAVIYNFDGSQGPERLLFAVNPTLADLTIPLGETIPATADWRQIADHERFFSGHGARQPVESELFIPALGCGLWVGET
jgi:pullulanase